MIPIQLIHPIIVHFPIVFVLTLAILDLIAALRGQTVTGRTCLGNVSTALAVLAGLFALMAIVFGDIALEFAESTGWSSESAEIHESLGTTVAIVLIIWAALRAFAWFRNFGMPGWARALVPVVELCTAAAVVATAYFGGQLVYDLGVNVAHI